MPIRENPTMEYKESVSATFLKTVSAYANYGTGKIVFGVDDAGAVVGLDDPMATCLRIENMINDSLDPAPRYSIEVNEADKTVTLTVYEGRDKPYRSKGKAYCRNDSATVEVDRLEYGRLTLEGSNLTFDMLPASEQNLTFKTLETKMSEKLGISRLTDDIMRTLRLLDRDGYTNAAAILADENSFPGVDSVRFGGSEDVIFDRETHAGISAFAQADGATQMFERYFCYEQIKGKERVRSERVPSEAFREAVANALVHRTWDVRANVQVAMYDNRVTITSPGSLPPGLSVEQYLHGQISVLRNPVIAEAFLKLGYIEKFGTGVERIRRSYRGSVSQPLFEVLDGIVTVTLPVIDAFSGSDEEYQVLKSLSNGEILTRVELEESTGLSRARVLSALESLVGQGMVVKRGAGRATKYARP